MGLHNVCVPAIVAVIHACYSISGGLHTMGSPTLATIKKLFALSGNQCAYPSCTAPIVETSGLVSGEICHIKAQRKGGPRFDSKQTENERHDVDNLLLLCRRHHVIVDSDTGTWTVDALQQIRQIRETYGGTLVSPAHDQPAAALLREFKQTVIVNNSGNVAVDSPGVIQGQTVNVRTSRPSVSVAAPAGTIGHNPDMAGYIEHLIKRYNEFAAKEPDRKTKFSYAAISKNLSDKFGSKWQLVSAERFEEAADYLQARIRRTRLAKINKGKGQKAFSTFEEYLVKYRREEP